MKNKYGILFFYVILLANVDGGRMEGGGRNDTFYKRLRETQNHVWKALHEGNYTF